MVSINRACVPKYLHDSNFYRSLDEDAGEISIPNDCCKSNTFLQNLQDLRHLLSTLRYWMISTVPVELFQFVISNKMEELEYVFLEFECELIYSDPLQSCNQQ